MCEAAASRCCHTELSKGWDRPRDAKDPVDIDDAVPDDSTVDHTGDRFDDE